MLLGPREQIGALCPKVQSANTWAPALGYNTKPSLLRSLCRTKSGKGGEWKVQGKAQEKISLKGIKNPDSDGIQFKINQSIYLSIHPSSVSPLPHQDVSALGWYKLHSDESASLFEELRALSGIDFLLFWAWGKVGSGGQEWWISFMDDTPKAQGSSACDGKPLSLAETGKAGAKLDSSSWQYESRMFL